MACWHATIGSALRTLPISLSSTCGRSQANNSRSVVACLSLQRGEHLAIDAMLVNRLGPPSCQVRIPTLGPPCS